MGSRERGNETVPEIKAAAIGDAPIQQQRQWFMGHSAGVDGASMASWLMDKLGIRHMFRRRSDAIRYELRDSPRDVSAGWKIAGSHEANSPSISIVKEIEWRSADDRSNLMQAALGLQTSDGKKLASRSQSTQQDTTAASKADAINVWPIMWYEAQINLL